MVWRAVCACLMGNIWRSRDEETPCPAFKLGFCSLFGASLVYIEIKGFLI